MLKISKQKIREILAKIRDMQKDPCFNVVAEQQNRSYYQYRAIEAIKCEDYFLACQLLVLLLVQGPPQQAVPPCEKMRKLLSKGQSDADRS